MKSATIVLMIAWLSTSGVPHLASIASFAQNTPVQETSPPNAPATPTSPAPAPKPCPADSPGQAALQPDCKPASKNRPRRGGHSATGTPATGPTKKVVRDGGASDTSSGISPDISPEQASQQLENTKGLLARTDQNLKILENRQLSAAQHGTVNQIHNYVAQSNAAIRDNDLQRAYMLANKARMLSGDLVKH